MKTPSFKPDIKITANKVIKLIKLKLHMQCRPKSN